MYVNILDYLSMRNNSVSKCVFQIQFGFALFLLLLREKHGVFLLICLFLLITKVFIKFKRILFDKNIRLCTFKLTVTLHLVFVQLSFIIQCTL